MPCGEATPLLTGLASLAGESGPTEAGEPVDPVGAGGVVRARLTLALVNVLVAFVPGVAALAGAPEIDWLISGHPCWRTGYRTQFKPGT